MSGNGSLESSNSKVKFDSLSELKNALGINNLDTTQDTEFREKISLEFTRQELDSLKAELGAEGIDKTQKLKEILKQKGQIHNATKVETSILNQDFMKEKPTPEGMKKAFEFLEKNQIKGAHRYMILSALLDKFIYNNKLLIRQDGRFITNFEVADNEGKINKDYSDILDKNLSKDDFKQTKIFQIALREGGIEKRANSIAKKYGINLNYKNEKEKQQIKSQILGNSNISEEDQTLLTEYLDGNYDNTSKLAQDYTNEVKSGLAQNSKELGKAGLDISQAGLAKYARNPDKLIGDTFTSLSKDPILLFSTIGLIIGKIFGFDIKGANGSFLMKLFAVGAGLGVYKAIGAGEYIGDLIEGKNGARDPYLDGTNAAGEYISTELNWAWGKIKKLSQELQSGGKALAEKISLWYYVREYVIIDSSGTEKSILDSNFLDISGKVQNGSFKTDLKNPKPKPEDKPLTNIEKAEAQIRELEANGIKKFGTKEKFQEAVKGKTITEVIAIINGDLVNISKGNKNESNNYSEAQKQANERVNNHSNLKEQMLGLKENEAKTEDYLKFINSVNFQSLNIKYLLYNENIQQNIFSNERMVSDKLNLTNNLDSLILKRILRIYLNFKEQIDYSKEKPGMFELQEFENKYLSSKDNKKSKNITVKQLLDKIYTK